MAKDRVQAIANRITTDTRNPVSVKEAAALAGLEGEDILELIFRARRIAVAFKKDDIFTCSILNAKSGKCSQDCAFCAQSGHYQTGVTAYPLLSRARMVKRALDMDRVGATHFSMVTSGYTLTDREIDRICETAFEIKNRTQLKVCCSLGMLNREQAQRLKQSGVSTYHHNLETAQSFFSKICTTHAYEEDIDTIKTAAAAGLNVCSGGVLGLGESWQQRIELAFALKKLNIDSIPINFLNPIAGTPLQDQPLLSPLEALKCIALFRFIHPRADIIVCGGREPVLRDYRSWLFLAGANGLMIGNYLTTQGRKLQMDLDLVREMQSLRKL